VQELYSYGGFYQDFKGTVGARQCLAGSEFLQEAPERVMHEALMVKLKMQWRPHDVRNFIIVKCLPRKATDNE
jgi:hypothetical protein